MKTSSWLPLSFTLVVLFSCGKHAYVLKTNELEDLAKAAKVPGIPVFVIYKNGDTVKGKELVIKNNMFQKKSYLQVDGKDITIDNVVAYQNKRGYHRDGGTYTRIYSGKINLYYSVNSDSKETIIYHSANNSFTTMHSGGPHTTCFMEKGSQFVETSYEKAKSLIADNPTALKQYDVEFPPKKNHAYMYNDLRAFIRILKVYDQQ